MSTLFNMARPEVWTGLLGWDLRFNESAMANDLAASKFEEPRDRPVSFAGQPRRATNVSSYHADELVEWIDGKDKACRRACIK